MLDLIIGPLLEYGPLGDLNRTSVDGKNEVWYNSKIDITFGDSTSWLIGLGRMTNIFGPDLKVVADWLFISELLIDKIPLTKLKNILEPLSGSRGATDLILGGKDSLNYGPTKDISIVRKKDKPLEVKIFGQTKGQKLWPTPLVKLIIFPYLVLLTIVVTSRLAYMQVGKFSEKNVRDQVRGALNMSAPLIESRWVACLLLYEKLTFTADELKIQTAKFNSVAEEFSKQVDADAAKLQALPENILITDQLKKRIIDENNKIKQHLAGTVKYKETAITKAVDYLKVSIPYMGQTEDEFIKSNSRLDSTYRGLTYNVDEAINFNATSGKLNSIFALTPDAINLKSAGTSFQFGSIANQKGMIDISFSENAGYIKLGADGGSLSHMTIRNESILIQSGKTNTKNPTIELSEGQIKLRCGSVAFGPEILIKNNELTFSVGGPLGSSFVMSDKGINLEVGALSILKISTGGIDIKSGLTTSTKWSAQSIDMAVAENKIKIGLADLKKQAIMLKKNIDAVDKIKSVLSKLDVSAISDTNAALRTLS